MELIEREELKAKIDRGDDFRLVNALGGWAFRASRIPGSVHFDSPEEAMALSGWAGSPGLGANSNST